MNWTLQIFDNVDEISFDNYETFCYELEDILTNNNIVINKRCLDYGVFYEIKHLFGCLAEGKVINIIRGGNPYIELTTESFKQFLNEKINQDNVSEEKRNITKDIIAQYS